jgi:large subunit ribosomal protein L25
MSEFTTFNAEARERAGKGAARAVRKAGRIPAVIYGDKKDPVSISLDPKEYQKITMQPGFFSTMFDIKIGGKMEKALARDVQLHPVTDRPLHLDFLRVGKGTEIAINVPVSFINEEASPGIKRGGVLNVVRHDIELLCPADAILQQVEIDLTGLDIGDGVHISAIKLPDGVTPTITDRDFTIATIAAPTVMKAEEESEDEEGEEGETEESTEE